MIDQETAYQSLLYTLQRKNKLSAAELKKAERVRKASLSEGLPNC